MAKISDPHGLHDWSSKEYVRNWATRQDRYEDERRPQFQMIADAIPFTRDAAIQILDMGAGYGGPNAISLGTVSQRYSSLPGWLGRDGQARSPAHGQTERP